MMKVQSQPVAQTAATSSTTSTAKTADAKPATAAAAAAPASSNAGQQPANRFQDAFVPPNRQPIPRDWPPYGPLPLPPKDTLGLGDQLTAGRLPQALSNPLDQALLDTGKKDQHLSRDDQGVMRGPDGQPLAKVTLKDGNTAYVDPNTNQYYLTNEREFFGNVNAVGPLPLPKDAQFSNSYFSDGDVKTIERDARGGGLWPIDPPRPPVFPGPIGPLPRPFPIDPLPKPFPIDPGILLDAAGKVSGNQ
jgi:hypothetical protein